MSLAGIRSNRGDSYQRAVALNFIVKMLFDEDIIGIQVDAIATPNSDIHVYGDDIIVSYKNGNSVYIQAKVNQKNHHYWRLTDDTLKKELVSAKEQLQQENLSQFHFYSRTPFGKLQRLIEEVDLFISFATFKRDATNGHKEVLTFLANIWDLEEEEAFNLVKRIKIGEHHNVKGWESLCLQMLASGFPNADTVFELIWSYIDHQHSKIGTPTYIVDRECVLTMLKGHGIHYCSTFDLDQFERSIASFSTNGRQWVRTVGNIKIKRACFPKLTNIVDESKGTYLLEDIAGGGKTCILLDLMEYAEASKDILPLFIKGDLYSSISALEELTQFGLPSSFVSKASFIPDNKKLVVIIDSLDVLAVGRSHNALSAFLSLIADLSNMSNVLVIAASRSFDAKYDPMLREAKWTDTITINPLDFEDEIVPLLTEWKVNHEKLDEKLKDLILVPQNLRLFYEIIIRGASISDIEGYDLYDVYTREVIENDPMLGANVVLALEDISSNLLRKRSYQFHRDSLALNRDDIQRLLSSEVIIELNQYEMMFAHQTLADALRIRQATRQNIALKEFVYSQPQFPFVRPAVRAYILALRHQNPSSFIRHFIQFVIDDGIAKHLKRLGVETFSGMSPLNSDIALINKMASSSLDLYSRFLASCKSPEWFELLYYHWLPTINVSSNQELIVRFFNFSAKFMDTNPNLIIQIWNRAIDEKWIPIERVTWLILSETRRMKTLAVDGFRELLEKLHSIDTDEHSLMGRVLCKYIEDTGSGYELLWNYIRGNFNPLTDFNWGAEHNLRCDSHNLKSDKFLQDQLCESDVFISMALDMLLEFGIISDDTEESEAFCSNTLHHTSWGIRHNKRDNHHIDSPKIFLSAIETALKYRAVNNDAVWKKYEPLLRHSRELGIRYLLFEAYKSNITSNIDAVSEQLTDQKVLNQSSISYEIYELSLSSYPYLSIEIQDKHQNIIVDMFECDARKGHYRMNIYDFIFGIPCYLRSDKLRTIYKHLTQEFNELEPKPYIYGTGGIVRSPIDIETFLALSEESIFLILLHYNDYTERSLSDYLLGGRESIIRILDQAAANNPIKFLQLIPKIETNNLTIHYTRSIIDGVSRHIRVRFGNLQDNSFQPVEPLPDGMSLALALIVLIERYGAIGKEKGEYTYARAIEACADLMIEFNDLKRLFFQFWKFGLSQSPDRDDLKDENLAFSGQNSVRGIIADSAVKVACNLLEQEKTIPKDLEDILLRYASDKVLAVKTSFLWRFPYLLSLESDLGWKLMGAIIRNCIDNRFYKFLEKSLYYQYYKHFDLVKPYLDILEAANEDGCYESWGRLATLSHLAGHISKDEIFGKLEAINSKSVLTGAGQVFVQNLDNKSHQIECINGILYLFNNSSIKEVYGKFERKLDDKEYRSFVPDVLIERFVINAPIELLRDINGLFLWLVSKVSFQPDDVLKILELLIARLPQDKNHYFYRPEDLVMTIKLLLQHADLIEDDSFVHRVLEVQDWFLINDVEGIESLLESY